MTAAKPRDTSTPNSIEVYVADAVGDRYCHSCSDIKYEQQAVKHARWYMRQRNLKGFDGKPLSICRPLRLVVTRYHDPSQRP